jgi:hypothetical protein
MFSSLLTNKTRRWWTNNNNMYRPSDPLRSFFDLGIAQTWVMFIGFLTAVQGFQVIARRLLVCRRCTRARRLYVRVCYNIVCILRMCFDTNSFVRLQLKKFFFSQLQHRNAYRYLLGFVLHCNSFSPTYEYTRESYTCINNVYHVLHRSI